MQILTTPSKLTSCHLHEKIIVRTMKNKKILVIGLITLALIAMGAYWWMIRTDNHKFTPTIETANKDVNVVDYGPPADTDKIQSSDKDKIINDETMEEDAASIQITQSTQQESTVYIRTIITGIT